MNRDIKPHLDSATSVPIDLSDSDGQIRRSLKRQFRLKEVLGLYISDDHDNAKRAGILLDVLIKFSPKFSAANIGVSFKVLQILCAGRSFNFFHDRVNYSKLHPILSEVTERIEEFELGDLSQIASLVGRVPAPFTEFFAKAAERIKDIDLTQVDATAAAILLRHLFLRGVNTPQLESNIRQASSHLIENCLDRFLSPLLILLSAVDSLPKETITAWKARCAPNLLRGYELYVFPGLAIFGAIVAQDELGLANSILTLAGDKSKRTNHARYGFERMLLDWAARQFPQIVDRFKLMGVGSQGIGFRTIFDIRKVQADDRYSVDITNTVALAMEEFSRLGWHNPSLANYFGDSIRPTIGAISSSRRAMTCIDSLVRLGYDSPAGLAALLNELRPILPSCTVSSFSRAWRIYGALKIEAPQFLIELEAQTVRTVERLLNQDCIDRSLAVLIASAHSVIYRHHLQCPVLLRLSIKAIVNHIEIFAGREINAALRGIRQTPLYTDQLVDRVCDYWRGNCERLSDLDIVELVSNLSFLHAEDDTIFDEALRRADRTQTPLNTDQEVYLVMAAARGNRAVPGIIRLLSKLINSVPLDQVSELSWAAAIFEQREIVKMGLQRILDSNFYNDEGSQERGLFAIYHALLATNIPVPEEIIRLSKNCQIFPIRQASCSWERQVADLLRRMGFNPLVNEKICGIEVDVILVANNKVVIVELDGVSYHQVRKDGQFCGRPGSDILQDRIFANLKIPLIHISDRQWINLKTDDARESFLKGLLQNNRFAIKD